MTDAWDRIFTDDRLRRARTKLSAHEILLIVHHAADAERDRIVDWLGTENITANNIGASLERNLHRPRVTKADLDAVFLEAPTEALCDDCPPVGYPTDKTRCTPCPRRVTEPQAPDSAQ